MSRDHGTDVEVEFKDDDGVKEGTGTSPGALLGGVAGRELGASPLL